MLTYLGVKRPSAVVASLAWKPFEARFADILDRMAEHRRFVWQQLIIWHASESAKEIARAAAERDLAEEEREDAAQERRLAQEERMIRRELRDMDAKEAKHVTNLLSGIQTQITAIENGRKGLLSLFLVLLPRALNSLSIPEITYPFYLPDDAYTKIQRWIAAPSYASHYEKAQQLRAEGTARWLFEEEAYQQWLCQNTQTTAQKRHFGSQILWIQGRWRLAMGWLFAHVPCLTNWVSRKSWSWKDSSRCDSHRGAAK